MKEDCPFCPMLPEEKPEQWIIYPEPTVRSDGLIHQTTVHHPTHEVRSGFVNPPIVWDYSAETVVRIGNGDFHRGINRINARIFQFSPDQLHVNTLRPFALEIRMNTFSFGD